MTLVSPRSSNYERLEGGFGPGRSTVKRIGWKKIIIALAVVLVLVWIFRFRGQTRSRWSEPPPIYNPPSPPPALTKTHSESHPSISVPPVHEDNAKPPPPRPTSFATDPDPSKTVYCTSPSKPSLPLVQYALMIDAGSTGSRIHVYKFNNCGPSPAYEYELFKKIQPGLSAFSGRPEEAARSLDVLLDEAVKVVPEPLRKCTPVAVKATAGLRLLGGEESGAILGAVERRLKERYPFLVPNQDGVVIMDGKDEGVYAWITANYMLGTIRGGGSDHGDMPSSTYAVLDLGGASTQIVFEPLFSKPDSSLVEGEHKYDLVFGGRKYQLYQHSYLGYGMMRARKSVHRLVEFMASLRSEGSADGKAVGNPCLAKGTQRWVEIEDERTGEKRNVTMGGEDIGSFRACNRVVELVLAKDAICEVKPCSFDGVYQPSLLDTFAHGKVLLLSYFYDRLQPLLPKTNPPPITASTFGNMAQDVCEGKSSWTKRWGADNEVMAELEGRPEWCLDLTFMHALLRLGYEFTGEREVTIGKQIEGTELGWALGATLAMVAGELKCRV